MTRQRAYTFIVSVVACVLAVAFIVRRKRLASSRRTDIGSRPLQPVVGRVSQGYSSSHRAVDVAVAEGTEVRCPWDGTVTRVWDDNTYGGGLSMLVKHDNGFTTGYAHLSGYHFGSGGRVLQGQNLALTGNSGSHSTGPHLHFTLRDASGVKIDPTEHFSFNN